VKLSSIAIAACILAFLSLPLEWWTLQKTDGFTETEDIYLYRRYFAAGNGVAAGTFADNTIYAWGWEGIILMVAGGLLAAVSSVKARLKNLWLSSGLCMLLAVILFSNGALRPAIATGMFPYPNLGVLAALFAAGITFFGYLRLRREQTSQTNNLQGQSQ
jgi:hypothetical protein